MAVNVVQSALSSRRVSRWLPWIAGAVLAAGVIAFLIAYFGNTAKKETFQSGKPSSYAVQREVPLSKGARIAAGKFILDAVQRRNLPEAWNLVTDQLKGGLSYKEWLTGNIPVIPFNAPIWQARIKVDHSYSRDAELEVLIVPRKNKNGIDTTWFSMTLKKVGAGTSGRWLVDYWDVLNSPPLPRND